MLTHPSHVMDAVVACVTTVAASASALIVSEHASAEQAAELQLFLLPLIGAMIMTTGAWLLNTQEEVRKQTLGRCIVAIFVGTLGPQILAMLRPSVAEMALKPVFLFAVGGLLAMLAYILIKPLFTQFSMRADKIVGRELDRAERLLPGAGGDDKRTPQN